MANRIITGFLMCGAGTMAGVSIVVFVNKIMREFFMGGVGTMAGAKFVGSVVPQQIYHVKGCSGY